MSYKGKWRPKNRNKYEGNPDKIIYRSMWERQAFRWCDDNDDIKRWSSESVVVPYRSQVDGKYHRYFVDLKITFNDGRTLLVEIKPKRQTKPPEKKSRRSRRKILSISCLTCKLNSRETPKRNLAHPRSSKVRRWWEWRITPESQTQ